MRGEQRARFRVNPRVLIVIAASPSFPVSIPPISSSWCDRGDKGDTKGNVQRQGVTEAETRGDRHIRKDDPCHLCHTYVSPVNPETLLGVTLVTPVSYTETRVVPGIARGMRGSW